MTFVFVGENKKSQKAILLLHGLNGSSYQMKKLGKYFFDSGFDAYGFCFLGHGDKVCKKRKVTWQDWYNEVLLFYKELSTNYEKVYICGFCLGSTLALALAQEFKKIDGVLLLSTAIKLDGWSLPWFIKFIPFVLNNPLRFWVSFPQKEPYCIKDETLRSKIKALGQKDKNFLPNYSLSFLCEFYKLSKQVQKKLNKIETPVLLIHSKEDDMVSCENSKFVLSKISSEIKKYIELNDSYHLIVLDKQKEFVFEKCVEFLKEIDK